MTMSALARRSMLTLGVVTMGLIATAPHGASSPAQGLAPQPREASHTEAKAGPALVQLQAWEREEKLARAREDVEIFELQLGARRAQLRKAELRLELMRTLQANTDRLKKKGLVTAADQRQAEVDVQEAESERSLKQADFAEVERRFHRARRRAALLEGQVSEATGIIETMGRDLEELKGRMARMEKKFDEELKDRMARMEKKLDRLIDESTGANGRLDRLEVKVFGKK